MAFQSIKFTYTPPPTITVPIKVETVQISLSGVTLSNAPIASGIISNLNNLSEANTYLQSVILALNSNTGITIDPNTDPEVVQALYQLYGLTPPIITASMYDNLLDCQNALQSINSALGPNSSAQADPYAIANFTQVNNFIQNALLDSSDSQALALASLNLLKGDNIIFSNTAIALSNAYTNSPVDASSGVSGILNNLTNTYTSIYSSLFTLLSTTSIIDQDIQNVLNTYAYQTVTDIMQITAVFKLLKTMKYKNIAKESFDSMGTLIVPRVMSELAPAFFSLDNIVQRVVHPLKNMTGILGATVNNVSDIINEVSTAPSILKKAIKSNNTNNIGLPSCNPCSTTYLSSIPGQVTKPVDFGKITSGLQFVSQHITLGQEFLNKEYTKAQSSLTALFQRKTSSYTDLMNVMCAIKSLESLISIGEQVANSKSIASLAANPSSTFPITNPLTQIPNIPSNVVKTLSISI